MRLITQNTDYAVRALLYMSKNKQQMVTAKQLSKQLDVPWSFLRRILQQLKKEGIIHSTRGRGGGFKLNVSPESIYLIDLITIFQGPVELNRCITAQKICSNIRTCPLRKKVRELEQHLVKLLKTITIQALLEDNAEGSGAHNDEDHTDSFNNNNILRKG
ncbi:MAG: RrF2 family transcriptional regulator [Spirochaetota bacterium]